MGNPVTVNDSRIFTVKEGQPPQNKVTHTQGNAIQVGCMKRGDGYGGLKSCEIEHTSQSYEALVNCSSYSSLPLRTI